MRYPRLRTVAYLAAYAALFAVVIKVLTFLSPLLLPVPVLLVLNLLIVVGTVTVGELLFAAYRRPYERAEEEARVRRLQSIIHRMENGDRLFIDGPERPAAYRVTRSEGPHLHFEPDRPKR